MLFGVFGYDRRGILDNSQLRFFTRATLSRQLIASGFGVLEEAATGFPLGPVTGGQRLSLVRRTGASLVQARPPLFGYHTCSA